MEPRHGLSWQMIFRIAYLFKQYGFMECDAHAEKMTITQEKILGVIFSHADGVMLKDIAKEMRLTPGAVSQSVDLLVREGLVEREAAPHDRRAVIIRPTSKGRDVRDRVGKKFTRVMESVLSDEEPAARESFVVILEKLYKAVQNCRHDSIRRNATVTNKVLEEQA